MLCQNTKLLPACPFRSKPGTPASNGIYEAIGEAWDGQAKSALKGKDEVNHTYRKGEENMKTKYYCLIAILVMFITILSNPSIDEWKEISFFICMNAWAMLALFMHWKERGMK